ncbi:MAG TPA: YcxB family protein [Microlunatus sp.]
MEQYVLTAAQPIRASVISAVADLIGAVLIVIGLDRNNTALTVIGIVLFVLGVGLAVAAAVLRQRLRTEVTLDGDGIRIRSAGRTAQARWSEITNVTQDQRSIYLAQGKTHGPTLKIDSPRGPRDPQFQRLAGALSERLDQDRGYHPL